MKLVIALIATAVLIVCAANSVHTKLMTTLNAANVAAMGGK